MAMHQTHREMLGVLRGLQSFLPHVQGSVIEVQNDNRSVVINLNHRGGPSRAMVALLAPILELAQQHSLTLQARWRRASMSTRVDELSRLAADVNDEKLNPRIFRQLEEYVDETGAQWGPFSVDLFATFLNRQTPRFFSWNAQPECAGIDALAQDWSKEANPYQNPPFNMIAKSLQKIRRDRVTVMTMVCPIWDTQPWWPTLMRMRCARPVLLPSMDDLFLPVSLGNQQGRGPPRWQAAVFRLSSQKSLCKPFQSLPWDSFGVLE